MHIDHRLFAQVIPHLCIDGVHVRRHHVFELCVGQCHTVHELINRRLAGCGFLRIRCRSFRRVHQHQRECVNVSLLNGFPHIFGRRDSLRLDTPCAAGQQHRHAEQDYCDFIHLFFLPITIFLRFNDIEIQVKSGHTVTKRLEQRLIALFNGDELVDIFLISACDGKNPDSGGRNRQVCLI